MSGAADRAKSIFANALEMALESERVAYIQAHCGEDPQLHREVTELLDHARRLGQFLESSGDSATAVLDQPPLERPGTAIGPYKLLDKLGEGGMGVVFLAEQREPIERQVALKVIRPGMDTQRVITRFEAERQALAVMDHPHVAKVLDAGTTDSGRPYFVMELVQGIAITKYCDQHGLGIRQRLELIIPVCQAVQHAHQKGIIHRDIKPSNILVAQCDGRAVPKVIDFGVAKAIEQRAAQKQLSTQYGQIVGTLEYMAPEQARLSQEDVDTRSDVYSLGAVLYELLTGITPFDKKRLYSAAFDQALHIIETEEPCKPSTRLSSSDSLPSVAALRNVEPQRLTGLIRGELDWIVMKALEKERSRRYESAASLAQDIEHYLHDEPVLAGPPSAAYRLRKFVRRNRRLLVTLGLLALLMVVGTAVSLHQAIRATRAEQLAVTRLGEVEQQRDAAFQSQQKADAARLAAEQSQQQAQTVTQYLVDAFRSPDPEVDGRTVTVAEILDRTVAELQDKFTDQPLVKARLFGAIGQAYLGLGLYDDALKVHQESLELTQRVLGRVHPDTLTAMNYVANGYHNAGRTEEAIKLHAEVLQCRHEHLPPGHPHTLQTMANLAACFVNAGRTAEAIQLHEEALQLRREHLGRGHRDTLVSMDSLAAAYLAAGRTAEAIALGEESLQLLRESLGPEHPRTLGATNNLATAYLEAGRHKQALELLERTLRVQRELLGPAHPDIGASMGNLACAYLDAHRTEDAIKLFEEALQFARDTRGPAHPDTLTAMNNLAFVYVTINRTEEAIKLNEETLLLRREHLGSDHPDTLKSMNNLAASYLHAGRTAEAIQLQEKSLDLKRAKLSPTHPSTLTDMNNLAAAYEAAGRTDEAITLHEETLRLRREHVGNSHFTTLASMDSLARIYVRVGRVAEAMKLCDDLLQAGRDTTDPEHADTLRLTHNFACYLTDASCTKEAIALHEKTLPLLRDNLGPGHANTLMSMRGLATAYAKAARFTEAITLCEETLELQRKHLPKAHLYTRNLISSLAHLYESVERFGDAHPLYQELLAIQRESQPDDPEVAGTLASLALNLLAQAKYTEAEPYAREGLQIRQQKLPDDWRTYNTQILLGRSLVGQKKLEEAEPLLLGGYQGMKERAETIPAEGKIRLVEAVDGLIQLYTDWTKPQEVEKWQYERAATAPAPAPPPAAVEPTEQPREQPAPNTGG